MPFEPTDQDLLDIITTDLLNDPRLSSHRIQVSVVEGVVTLDGCVQSFRRKLLAHEIVSCYEGVRDLVNRLRVEPSEPAGDREVADRVRAALDASADVTKETVTVAVHDGKVTLEGNVGCHWERVVAEDVALSVRGVRDVRNLLVVNLMEKADDEEVSHAISAALLRACGLTHSQIHVAVSNNTVVLAGEVPSFAHKETAHRVVERFGLTHVRNDLVVMRETEGRPSTAIA